MVEYKTDSLVDRSPYLKYTEVEQKLDKKLYKYQSAKISMLELLPVVAIE